MENQEEEQRQQEFPLQPWPGNSRPLNRPTLSPQHQQRVNLFWQSQIYGILATSDFHIASLPIARIRRQMRSEITVPNVSAEVTHLVAKACELLIEDLVHRAWLVTESAHRMIIRSTDISSGIEMTDMYDFLVDILPWADPRPFVQTPRSTNHQAGGSSRRRNYNNGLGSLINNNNNNNNSGGGFRNGNSGIGGAHYNYQLGINGGIYAAPNYNNTGTGMSVPNQNNYLGEGSSTGIGTSASHCTNYWPPQNNIVTNTPNYNNSTVIDTSAPNYNNNINNSGAIIGPNHNLNPQENAWQTWPGLGGATAPTPSGPNGTNYITDWEQGFVQQSVPVVQGSMENSTMDGFLSSYCGGGGGGGGGTGVPNYFAPDSQGPMETNWTGTENWGLDEIFDIGNGTSVDNPIVVEDSVEEVVVPVSQGIDQGNQDGTGPSVWDNFF